LEEGDLQTRTALRLLRAGFRDRQKRITTLALTLSVPGGLETVHAWDAKHSDVLAAYTQSVHMLRSGKGALDIATLVVMTHHIDVMLARP
jgi:hypothetical protein